jgi:hypothetical protein
MLVPAYESTQQPHKPEDQGIGEDINRNISSLNIKMSFTDEDSRNVNA